MNVRHLLIALSAAGCLTACNGEVDPEALKRSAIETKELREEQLQCYALFKERFKALDFSGVNRCDKMIERGLSGPSLLDEMMPHAFPELSKLERVKKLKEILEAPLEKAPPIPPIFLQEKHQSP